MSRTFTREEAQTLLPTLGALLRRARAAALRASGLEFEMQELSQRIFLSGGLHVDVPAAARRRAEREKAVQEARQTVEEIEAVGAQVGDMHDGLLEFPSTLDGRAILLSWKLGEDEIAHWREPEDDTSVRRDLGERFQRKERKRPN